MKDRIVVSELGKQFRRYHPDRPWTLQEAVLQGLRRMRPLERFWALRDVSLSVGPGKMMGIVGANGSGKSTLLRLVGGVMRPDKGEVKVNGRIGALLELGAGLHHDLTGRENIFIAGVLGGLTRREVAERFDSIVAFAELEHCIENPIRTYSTGMQMRLAFATAVHVEPEILLIDEVLSVGDLSFQHKCFERIARFKRSDCAILLVSHDVSLIRELCDEAIWLNQGKVMAQGPANQVTDQYVEDMASETRRRTPETGVPLRTASGTELLVNKNRFGSLEMEITKVRLLDQWGAPATEIQSGSPLRVELDYVAPQPTFGPIFKVCIFRQDGLACYDINSQEAGTTLSTVHGKGRVSLNLERLDLNSGIYFIDVGVFVGDWTYAYDYHSRVYPLTVRGDGTQSILFSPHCWETSLKEPALDDPGRVCSTDVLVR